MLPPRTPRSKSTWPLLGSGDAGDGAGVGGGLAATVTSPFGWRTICRPEPAPTEMAPDRTTEPPGKVTEFVPLETVIVPGILDVTSRPPSPLGRFALVTPLETVAVPLEFGSGRVVLTGSCGGNVPGCAGFVPAPLDAVATG